MRTECPRAHMGSKLLAEISTAVGAELDVHDLARFL